MAGLDISSISSEKEVEIGLRNMVESGRVRSGDMCYINPRKIMKLLDSVLGREMKAAKAAGSLFREQPFVVGVRAGEVLPETESDSMVLVQGIIDVFYETSAGIVLIDYKTDRLEAGQEHVLADRYRKQMDLYAYALEEIIGKPVVKRALYSFSLDGVIEL